MLVHHPVLAPLSVTQHYTPMKVALGNRQRGLWQLDKQVLGKKTSFFA